MTTIIDTGADPIVIQKNVLVTTSLKNAVSIQASVRSASGSIVFVEGIVSRFGKVGGHVKCVDVGMALNLATEMILRMAFIDSKGSNIESKKQQIVSRSASTTAIIESIKVEVP